MNRCVVDASVATKWFSTEEHSSSALGLLRSDCELLAPDLIWAEVGNAIWKKTRSHQMAVEEAREILVRFKRFPLQTFEIKTMTETAWELAVRLDMAIYDCFYLALALANDATFVTADRKFYNSFRGKMVPGRIAWIGDISQN